MAEQAHKRGQSQAGEDRPRYLVSVPTPEDLSQATRRLDLALTDLNAVLARRLQVSQVELMAIAHVSFRGDLGPSELAHHLDVTTGAVTALVDRLAERGHLERHPHPADRRKLLLTATPHAREEVLRHVTPLADDIRELASSFSDEERVIVGRYLAALTEIIERHAKRDDDGSHPHQTGASLDDNGPSRRDPDDRHDSHVPG